MEGSDFNIIRKLANLDVSKLEQAERSYGDSWRKRGGIGAFMMLARKWDRIENQVTKDGMTYLSLSIMTLVIQVY